MNKFCVSDLCEMLLGMSAFDGRAFTEPVLGAVVIHQTVAELAGFAVALNVRFGRPGHKDGGGARLNSLNILAAHPGANSIKYWFAGSQLSPRWSLGKTVNAIRYTEFRHFDVVHVKAVNDQRCFLGQYLGC